MSRFPFAYWGSIGYFKQLVESPTICLEQEEHYVKQTLRNRMYILGPNKTLPLSIPVIKVNGSKTAMKDILIAYQEDWQKEHLKALETAYSSSPYYEHYLYEIEPFYSKKKERLIDFHLESLELINQWLDLGLTFQLSQSFDLEEDEKDFRQMEEVPHNSVDYSYHQVFQHQETPFIGNLSILDAVFNLGPMARRLLIE